MGSKSINLERLRANGIRVPLGITVPSTFYAEATAKCYDQVLEQLSDERCIFEVFSSLPLDDLRARLNEECQRFHDETLFAVRSSGEVFTNGCAIKEDGSKVSLAGQFESYLNVGRDELVKAILMCWASLFNRDPKALSL